MLDPVKRILGGALSFAPVRLQTYVKEEIEILYWKRLHRKSNGQLWNKHFQKAFTVPFDIDEDYFAGKRMLDIGCGPTGSLEWAENAADRVGVDPLAERYRRLHGSVHKMQYVTAGAESLPFPSACFEIVSTFNALDHVESPAKAIAEAQRVVAPGGDILLIVEINHPPTLTEPHFLTVEMLEMFDECTVVSQKTFAMNAAHNVYESINEAVPPKSPKDPAILCARLQKKPVTH